VGRKVLNVPLRRSLSADAGGIRRALAFPVVACGLGLSLLAPPASLAQSSVTASVTPAEAALSRGGSATGVLLVSNAGDKPTDVHIRIHEPDASVSVSMPTENASVPAKASVALTFTVRRSTEGSGQDTTVNFVVDPTSGQTAVTTLKVKAAASLALVEAKIEANLQNINENRPGTGALVITNLRESGVTVGTLEVSAPLAVVVTLACPGRADLATPAGETSRFTSCRLSVAPRSQELLPITLEAQDAVTPGPRSLLVQVTATRPGGGSQSVVASTAFTVDVFAESDIVKSIGVPIFLLLPGVIIVVTAWFLIRTLPPWRKIAHGVNIGDVVSKATVAAILGLAVSLAVALVYPYLTTWFVPGAERNYVKAYGFRDFYYVIGYSFVIAFLVWGVAAAAFWVVRWLLLPWPGDDAASLMRKIGIRGKLGGRTQYPRVTLEGDKKGLELGSPGDRTLVVPTIAVAPDTMRAPDLSAEITSNVNSDNAFELWRVVRRSLRDKHATIAFRSGDVAGPRLLTEGDGGTTITRVQSPGPVVEVGNLN
jgi:hypothetical protein